MILDTIKEGKIVPSELTVKLIQKEMESSDNYKFLIDGFPRSEDNRIAFEQIVSFFCTLILFSSSFIYFGEKNSFKNFKKQNQH